MNKLNPLFFIFLSFFGKEVLAQNEPYQFPKEVPQQYRIDAERMYDSIVDHADWDIKNKHIERFAEKQSFALRSYFYDGSVYLGWDEMETYLNEVLRAAMPDSLRGRDNIHVYPTTWTGSNAFAFHDGTIFYNVGFFAENFSEAELAFTLGHELVHYIEKDVRDRFIRSVKEEEDDDEEMSEAETQRANRIERAAYSREQERIADSLGWRMAAKGGYNIEHGIASLYHLLGEKEKREAQEESKEKSGGFRLVKSSEDTASDSTERGIAEELLFASHPLLEDRIERGKELVKKLEAGGKTKGKAFKVFGRKKFQKLREKARKETVRLLLERSEYRRCVAKAFRYHLQKPEDPVYLKHLIEGLRRYIYVNPAMADKGFLTQPYGEHFADTSGILENLHFFIRDSLTFNSIKAEHYLDEDPEFQTFGEAFDHFIDLGREKGLPSADLAIALKLHQEEEMDSARPFIENYLAHEGIEHRSYAEHLKNETLFEEKGSKELLIIDNINFLEYHFYGFHKRHIKEEEKEDSYFKEARDFIKKRYPSKEVRYMGELQKKNIGRMIRHRRILASIQKYSSELGLQEGKKKKEEEEAEEKEDGGSTEDLYFSEEAQKSAEEKKEKVKKMRTVRSKKSLFHLSPSYWKIYRKEDLKGLGYISNLAYDDRTQLLNALNLINPIFYLRASWNFLKAYIGGSDRFRYQVVYLRYSPWKEKEVETYGELVPYKMTRNNFLNSIYYALKNVHRE